MRILMVCLGNICRSPLAEGIMKSKLAERGLDWEVDSAGTGYWHAGDLPDRRSIATARRHGIDITDQRARQFKPGDFTHFDHILVMDLSNQRNVRILANTPEHEEKVQLILDYSHPGESRQVPDPYYDDNGFEAVYEILDEACSAFIKKHA
jgi:protein-tyrosine phosphatase